MKTSVAIAAKEIRTALKVAFPHVKFSVRSSNYSMGSSIRVEWVDGPTPKQVEAIANEKQEIRYDHASGEILSGGNRFVFCSRELSERVKAYIAKRIPSGLESDYDINHWSHRVGSCVEVRPCGQILEWREFSIGRVARDAAKTPALRLVGAQ